MTVELYQLYVTAALATVNICLQMWRTSYIFFSVLHDQSSFCHIYAQLFLSRSLRNTIWTRLFTYWHASQIGKEALNVHENQDGPDYLKGLNTFLSLKCSTAAWQVVNYQWKQLILLPMPDWLILCGINSHKLPFYLNITKSFSHLTIM